MPPKWFVCPDGNTVEIEECLSFGGCRMNEVGHRCAPVPYLRKMAEHRKWRGFVSPSRAGTGPRNIFLQYTTDYAVNPEYRAYAALGISTHESLSMHKFTHNVLAEEELSDEETKGIADILEEDEWNKGSYILSDYKTWGSFKVAKAKGIFSRVVPILDKDDKPILYKTGKNKGKPKTRKEFVMERSRADLRAEELQLNRYRIIYEEKGFPISRMFIYVIQRDGRSMISAMRGVNRNTDLIEVRRLPNEKVLEFYRELQGEVEEAFKTGWVRPCNEWESWEGNRCRFCDVKKACERMGNARP